MDDQAFEQVEGLALQRTPEQGCFSSKEQAELVRLGDPLSAAATLARLLGEARVGGIVDTLDAFGSAAFLLDRLGRVTRASRRAETLLGGDLSIIRGHLAAPQHATVTTAIKRLMEAALWSSLAPAPQELGSVWIPRQERRPLMLQVHPLTGSIPDYFSQSRAVAVVFDPDECCVPEAYRLRRMFGLSESEARLALALGSTWHLPRAAITAGMTYETARSYMKAILEKTSTSCQAEFLALLTRVGRR